MPDTFLTTGVSLGLLAGVVSGVCYLVANGLAWPRHDQKKKRCIPSTQHEGVCLSCGGDSRGGIIPCICTGHQAVKFESGFWFLRQVQRAVSLMPWSLSTDKLELIEEEECDSPDSPGSSEGPRELRNVREFLEALSAKLAGGALEGTRVAPLYHHPAYLSPRDPSQPSSSHAHASSGASGAHAQLKRLVARVVEEAAALPALARYAAEPTTPTIETSTYEDLLATAILNKVIERYQTENGSGGRSSGIHSASASPTPSERSSPRSLNSRARDISPPLREEDELSDWEEGEATASDDALELPRRVPFPEFGGDIVHATDNDDRDFDEVSGSDIQAVDGSWEENWLFQKKKIKTIQSVPVPMLVPNSNTEYRALIGDRDADDTTDLSDNASEGDEEAEYKSDIKRVLDSKHVIGGKPKIDELLDFEPDSLNMVDAGDEFEICDNEQDKDVVDAVNNEINDDTAKPDNHDKQDEDKDSVLVLGMDSGPLTKAEFALKEEIHRTLLNGTAEDFAAQLEAKINGEEQDELDKMHKGSMGTLSRHEREGEYEETVTKPVQRYADSLRRKHFEDEPQHIPTRDTDKEDDLIPGSIAYRERKKWLNYVEMPNNPYSPEAIQKRLSAKSTSSLFDMLTKPKDLDDDDRSIKSENINGKESLKEHDLLEKDERNLQLEKLNTEGIIMNGNRPKSPSPRILKDVLAEEVPQYKRYGRDYYIREAKVSAGGRRKREELSETSSLSSMNKSTSLDNFDTEFASPGLLIKQFNTIASNQHYTKFAPNQQMSESITTLPNNKTEIMIEYDDVNEQTLFNAKPAYVEDDTDRKFEEILESAYNVETDKDEPKSPMAPSIDNSYVSSSSLEDSIKIYNVQTGEIVKSKPDNVSPRYEEVEGNDNIDTADKNILEDRVSEESDVDDESFEIVDRDSLREEKLDRISEIDEILPQLPNVKELAKKFVSMENLTETTKPQQIIRRLRSKENIFDPKADKQKQYMHSLTARSISREFREELKLSMATPLKVPGGSKEIPEGEEVTKESSRPGSPLPEPGTIKTKLAFFESLKSKFSSK
ncbi:uncharacterized protein LOC126373556 isoform X3 [Pectinophora gossypiella]|uniref:uncharacterized protein LOC126373556 isoform X3 n=1 Tax=Pectinophora gossypiella TaxID=13191 RepID=UPI00214F3CC6|nr:uncharacterized protein LOC126373556 isoform X3 [Pectinophora gossypiella]